MATFLNLAAQYYFWITLLTILSRAFGSETIPKDVKVRRLEKSENFSHTYPETGGAGRSLAIYCYVGQPEKWTNLWTSATMSLSIPTEDFDVFKGPNATDIYRQYNQHFSWFSRIPWKVSTLSFKPFDYSCVGISTTENYKVKFILKVFDPWLVFLTVMGLMLYFSAKKLSRNVMFYYGTGVSVGLIASLLVFVYILSRLVPGKKGGAYAVLLGGWSVSVWLLQYVWENIQTVLENYSQYVIGYFLVAGLISFALCYWKGPVTDDRSLNLIKWTIQLLAFLFVYNGSQIPQVSIAIIVTVLTLRYFPRSLVWRVRSYWKRKFPPKMKFLTEEEYLNQSSAETRMALEELREYCKSPRCDAWRTVSRLHSPSRFASFVEGDSHITDDELYQHEVSPTSVQLFNDDDSETEIDFRLNSP